MLEVPEQLMQDTPEACAENDRLENFRSAVFELQYNISHIEQKYPFLGTELSSLCEETISRLSWPTGTDTPPVAMGPANLPLPAAVADVQQSTTPEITPPVEQPGTTVIEATDGLNKNANRVAYSLDAAGGILVKGLDIMGDGIIIAFEKLLSLGAKGRKGPSAMEVR